MSNQFKSLKTRPGVSLLVSLILIGLLVLFGLIVSQVVVASIRESANVNRANQAFYAAEGALEKGLLVNWDKGAGYSNDKPQDVGFGQNGGPQANYKIMGQVPKDAKYTLENAYGIPAPGTGDAGTECDNLNPFVKGSFYYSKDKVPHYLASITQDQQNDYKVYDAINHPCNWGKLKVGESVTIPLYVTKKDSGNPNGPDIVLNPADQDFNLSSLKIKIRTPCEKGEEMCALNKTERFVLRDSSSPANPPGNYGGDDPIVNWQIVGTQKDGPGTYVLGPVVNYGFKGWLQGNAVIYSGKINIQAASGFQLLTSDFAYLKLIDEKQCSAGAKINDFLKNAAGICNWNNRVIYKPVLKLTIIHSLTDSVGAPIPYLEYQILTNALIAPTDIAQTITAEAYSGSFKQVLEVKQPQTSGVLEYVIQQ